jgi:hypothetical protein
MNAELQTPLQRFKIESRFTGGEVFALNTDAGGRRMSIVGSIADHIRFSDRQR